jgi:hypothetical protein
MTTATLTASPFAAFYATAEPEAETVTVCQILRLVSRDGRTQIFVCYRNASPAEQKLDCFHPFVCGVFSFEALPKTLRDMALKMSLWLTTTEHTLSQYRGMVDLDRYDSVRYWPGQYLPLG